MEHSLAGLVLIDIKAFTDERGWFAEMYRKDRLAEQGIDVKFVQDNHSYSSRKGTLRGIHFQNEPKAQSKLVRCTRGSILDIAVDLRKGSDTYKKWNAVVLSEQNRKQLFIPKGFGHGFVTLTDHAEVDYKVDEYYSKEHDRSIRFDDPELGIDWQIEHPILSEKDTHAPYLRDSDVNFSITVLVTGSQGQLGYEVLACLKKLGIRGIGVDIDDLDITDKEATLREFEKIRPDVVVHCAAYTAVDRAEEERRLCWNVNVEGTRNVAEACEAIGSKLLYISTDYVFDGSGTEERAEDAPTAPINYYGETKAMGEKIVRDLVKRHFIVRTSWLYGSHGNNFVKTMLRLAKEKEQISVVCDQVGSPTYAKDLAVLLCQLIQTRSYGTYHGINEGTCSWAEFAQEIFRLKGLNVAVRPISTNEYPTKASRPLNSRLGRGALDAHGFSRLGHWKDALARFLQELDEKGDEGK